MVRRGLYCLVGAAGPAAALGYQSRRRLSVLIPAGGVGSPTVAFLRLLRPPKSRSGPRPHGRSSMVKGAVMKRLNFDPAPCCRPDAALVLRARATHRGEAGHFARSPLTGGRRNQEDWLRRRVAMRTGRISRIVTSVFLALASGFTFVSVAGATVAGGTTGQTVCTYDSVRPEQRA